MFPNWYCVTYLTPSPTATAATNRLRIRKTNSPPIGELVMVYLSLLSSYEHQEDHLTVL
jgi:hypothetical protein